MPDLERRRLKKWVRSPAVNHREDVIILFDYLNRPHCRADKQEAFTRIWPGAPYNDALLRQTLHWLLGCMHQFLGWEEWLREPDAVTLYTARSLARRGLDKMAVRESEGSRKTSNTPYRRTARRYRNEYDMTELRYELRLKQRRSGVEGFENMTQLFENHAIVEILRLGCMDIAQKSMNREQVRLTLLPAALAAMHSGHFSDNAAAQAYFHSYCALSQDTPDAEHFEALKKLLTAVPSPLLPDEERDIYMLAVNYCIRRHNKGERHYTRATFELYRQGLEKQVFTENGMLSKFTYTNINLIALLLEEWEWADQFLIQYRNFLPETDREPYYYQNKAAFHFRQRNYGQTLELLQKVEFQEVFQALDARRMLLVSYYETDATEALYALLDSFSLFVRRKQRVLGYHREHYSNMLRFVRRLLTLDKKDKAQTDALRREILETTSVAEREWLLKQL